MIRLKDLLNESLLNELEFGTQKAFDSYQKQHDLRGDTKVTVAGKKMSVSQAVKQSGDKTLKGSPVFGNNKGGQVFGNKSNTVDIKSKAKELLSKSNYDEKQTWKLSDTADDIYNGLGGDKDSKELALKLRKNTKGVYVQTDELGGHVLFSDGSHYEINSDEGGEITASKIGADGKKSKPKSKPTNPSDIWFSDIDAFKNGHKAEKLKPTDVIDIHTPNGDEQMTYADALKKYGGNKGTPTSAGAKEKSITDIKVDAKVDVSKVSKSLLPNLKLDMSPGGADKDANELKTRLEKGQKGSYTRTSPTGGRIDFEDGASFDVYRPHTYKKTKDTKIYASKQNKK